MWKFSCQDQGVHKIVKKPSVFFFNFNNKYFFNKRTVTSTFRNPVKCNWNSTRKTKKKNLMCFILQSITPWNHKNVRNCYFCGYFRDLGSNVKFHGFLWFCEFLKVSASIFCFKAVLTLNSVFSLILNIYQGVLSEKTFYIKITIVQVILIQKSPEKPPTNLR